MAGGIVFLCGRQIKKVVTGSVTVERINGGFVVIIADEIYPSTSKIRDAVRVLENRSLACNIAQGFENSNVSKKAAKKIIPGFGVRYFPTEACYLLVVGDSSPHMDSEPISQEA